MRISLVRPNSRLRAATIPLGLGYVAESCRKAGHEVSLLDARVLRLSPEETAAQALSFRPDLIGLSAIHYEHQGVRDLAKALRAGGYTGPLLLGGPLVSTLGAELVQEEVVDAGVEGEGEAAILSYLATLSSGADLSTVPGLIYRANGEIRRQPPQLIPEIDDLLPAWDLIDPEKYFQSRERHTLTVISYSRRMLSLFSSRGCPFGCIYCHNVFGKKFRARSPESVLAEIEMLRKRYGVHEFEFVDDAFNLDLGRAKTIAEEIIRRGLKLHLVFANGLRADRMDEELIRLLKRAGTYRINYAVETASPRLQKLIHKNLDLDRTARVIEWTANQGIFTLGYFMLGFPTETEEEVKMTIDFALKSQLHSAAFFYVTPFPGTELTKKFPMPPNWSTAHLGMDYTAFSLNLSQVPDQRLQQLFRGAYRRFHFHPRRMWRTFWVVPKNFNTLRSAIIIAILSRRDLPNF